MDSIPLAFAELAVGSPEYAEALRLREAILREPLGLAWTADELRDEARCFHLAAIASGKVRAVLLLMPLDEARIKMRQVAVVPACQRRGIGAALVGYAERFAREHGYRTITAHARATAAAFYRRLGYRIVGTPFVEVGIPHLAVEKDIA
jgi:GNAT superfamily N-acetyltransferase